MSTPEVRLIYGDSLEILPTFESNSFNAIVTDPPYGSGGKSASERIRSASEKYMNHSQKTRWPEFEGEAMDQNAWAQWTYRWLKECRRVAKEGAPIVVFIDWRQLPLVTTLLQWAGWNWMGIAVWDKTGACRPQLGRFAAQAEFIVWGVNGKLPFKRGVGALPGVFRHRVEPLGKRFHMVGKPVALMEDVLRIVEPGGKLLDPFAGSGTTLVAARNLGLQAIGIEATKDYYDVTLQRLQSSVTNIE